MIDFKTQYKALKAKAKMLMANGNIKEYLNTLMIADQVQSRMIQMNAGR